MPTAPAGEGEAVSASQTGKKVTIDPAVNQGIEEAIAAWAAQIEAQYGGPGLALDRVYWTGDPDQQAMGGVVLFNNRGNKQIGIQWVPGDPRRGGRSNIEYAVDLGPTAPPALGAAAVEAAMDQAMGTWNNVQCSSGLSIDKVPPSDPDFDIVHAGFTDLSFLGPGVIAATFPFIFVSVPSSIPTDIDGDKNLDYAFALIFYSSQFNWAIDSNIDVETVTLHEAGHGLGQGHFGKLFINNGGVHFAPRAVMNAGYTGPQQSLAGTDNGGHCSIMGAWPNN